LKIYKYINKENAFDVETDGKSIFRIGLNPTKNANYSQNKLEIIEKLFLQLDEYFAGKRKKFNINLTLIGTDFQKSVWEELKKIPYGETISYSELAKKINKPKASRAVGGALNKNPIPIIIPCHRVIGKNGNLTGFAGGVELKSLLINLENPSML
jgi:methylated-DNA-[protein]-cysteine S-methyltransferase